MNSAHSAPGETPASLLSRCWWIIPTALAGCGVVAIVLGCALNPFVVERFLSADGELEGGTVGRLLLLDGAAVVLGVALLMVARAFRRYSAPKARIVVRTMVALASVIVMLFVLEFSLQLANRDGQLVSRLLRRRGYLYLPGNQPRR